ncbi:MAG: YvcK family protein [Polyangiaceae bacterium]|nr:YvcK family protein [Polyangiaceae bacterium]
MLGGVGHPHIVTIGGGTGHYTLLNGLRAKGERARITAIVTMMDSGGSSGRLRDEYGLLPPGDFTRCLVALSSHPEAMKELLGHRFRSGSLEGHTVRNLLFTALQEITGSVPATIERLHEIFAVENRVLPVTLDRVDLVVHLENDRIFRGEASIDGLADTLEAPVLSVYLEPEAEAYPVALAAIDRADLIVIGPGDLYTSLVPNLLARGVREAIAASRARVIYVSNLMTKPNETPGYSVEDFVGTMAMYLGEARLDAVLYNDTWPCAQIPEEYTIAGSRPVVPDPERPLRPGLLAAADLIAEGKLIRHEPRKRAAAIFDLARARGWI